MQTLEGIKQDIAHEYGSKDYRKDFEYGIGLNKFMDEWQFIDIVAKRYAQSVSEDLRERIIQNAVSIIDPYLGQIMVVDKDSIRNVEIILK